MIPSTGAITNQPLPQASTDIVPTSQTLAKSDILSSTIKPSTVDILRKSEIGRQAAVVGQKKLEASKPSIPPRQRPMVGAGWQTENMEQRAMLSEDKRKGKPRVAPVKP